jgi:hypothetical protein
VVRDKKAEYRALERMRAPWDPRIPLLEELAAVAPRDPEVVKWMEVYNAYRRERLQEGLEQALAQGDAKSFSALLQEGVNLLAAAEVLGWRLRFASAQAEGQAGARAYRAAQDLLRPFLTEGLPPERLRELHQKVEEWGRLADRADHAEALRLSYDRERPALSLNDREARLQALSMVAPELPELEAYRRELKEDQEAAVRQADEQARAKLKARMEALAAQHDALPPTRGLLERRSLRDELARLDAADPRLEAWGKEIADIERAEAIKAQLRGLAVTRETRKAYAGKIEDLRALMPQDQDLPGFARLLEAFDRAEQAAEAAEEARRRRISDLMEDYEALGPDASAAARERLLLRLEGLDPNHERLAVWKQEIKEAKTRQEKQAAEEAEAKRKAKEAEEETERLKREKAETERKASIETLAAQYDALPPGRDLPERESLLDELRRLDAADPRLAVWAKEIGDIEKAEAIKTQLRDLAVTHERPTPAKSTLFVSSCPRTRTCLASPGFWKPSTGARRSQKPSGEPRKRPRKPRRKPGGGASETSSRATRPSARTPQPRNASGCSRAWRGSTPTTSDWPSGKKKSRRRKPAKRSKRRRKPKPPRRRYWISRNNPTRHRRYRQCPPWSGRARPLARNCAPNPGTDRPSRPSWPW